MAGDDLNKGKISRKLVPVVGGVLLVAAAFGFLVQYNVGGGKNIAEEAALAEREKIEAAQLGNKTVSEEDARLEIEAKEAEFMQEKAKRDQEQKDRDALMAARMPESRLPPPMSDESMLQYEAAKLAATPAAKEGVTMVAYEDFPKARQNFASVVHDQATLPSNDGAAQPTSGEDSNLAWAQKTGSRVKAGTSKYLKPDVLEVKSVLLQGTVVNAVMRTALNTKLPGQIVASVTQDVYDSIRGERLLLPRGSQLIGAYNTAVMDGQNRVMMAFTRLIFPSGASVQLGGMSGSDALGIAGIEGKVDRHYFERFGAALLFAILANSVNQPDAVVNINSGGATSSSTAAGNILTDMAGSELQRTQGITPDITVPPGAKVSLILAADLALPPSITNKIPTED